MKTFKLDSVCASYKDYPIFLYSSLKKKKIKASKTKGDFTFLFLCL